MSKRSFVWRGNVVSDLAELQEIMDSLESQKEVLELKTSLEQWSSNAEMMLFRAALFGNDITKSEDLLSKFTGKDCHGTFYIVQLPVDEYGNTVHHPCIMEVTLENSYGGDLNIRVHAPVEISSKWPTLSPIPYPYRVTDGPARILSYDEWRHLVGFEYDEASGKIFSVDSIVIGVVEQVISELTDKELIALSLCVALDNDPRSMLEWSKIEPLFDRKDASGKPLMHENTKKAVQAVFNRRISG